MQRLCIIIFISSVPEEFKNVATRVKKLQWKEVKILRICSLHFELMKTIVTCYLSIRFKSHARLMNERIKEKLAFKTYENHPT